MILQELKASENKLIIIIIIIIILPITIIVFVQNITPKTYDNQIKKKVVSNKIIYLPKVNTDMNKQINKCNSAGILNTFTAFMAFF